MHYVVDTCLYIVHNCNQEQQLNQLGEYKMTNWEQELIEDLKAKTIENIKQLVEKRKKEKAE
tara:strand:+ start:1319 stop:1504 length:186 start_codon:yes stop_codon:yes gene_type:complete